jgi:hypothetical protein
MNNKDAQIAQKIWPQHMRSQYASLHVRLEQRKREMGSGWLLAVPVNRKQK